MRIPILSLFLSVSFTGAAGLTYPLVDTGQVMCYDTRSAITGPAEGAAYAGQDAQYRSRPPSYTLNDDGTVTDQVTGLMWTRDSGTPVPFAQATAGAITCRVGGYEDWRLPTIKELYSLIQFTGIDPDPKQRDTGDLVPFIDATMFGFSYGRPDRGERIIDAQYVSSTRYTGTGMNGQDLVFGVNFADGRIKGYPIRSVRGEKTFRVLYVRGNPAYGINRFTDNRNGTITDQATGLTWMQADSGTGMDWPEALAYAENLDLAGHTDWRLPDAKELQSIVDYSRSPDHTHSAALDPLFEATEIQNEGGMPDFASYWTSTTHAGSRGAFTAVYVAFGRALGFMRDARGTSTTLMDVHGAGAQRSDPKTGDASAYPTGRGPQGDVIRIRNLVRCVRGGEVTRVRTDSPGSGPTERPQEKVNRADSFFIQRLDRNGDHKVSRDEFDGPPSGFSRFDRNGDGSISLDEAPDGPPLGGHGHR